MSRERRLAEESFSSAQYLDEIRASFEFPRSVSRLNILDVGAGASSIPAELAALGARVVAVDYRYSNLNDLSQSVNRYLQEYSEILPKLSSHDAANAEDYIQRSYRTKDWWFSTRDRHQGVLYVAGMGALLPVHSNSIDFAYSEQAASRFIIDDYDVFLKSFQEVFRTLRYGGEYQMHPWYIGAEHFWGTAPLERVYNAGLFRQYLRDNSIQHKIVYRDYEQPTIHITKR